MTCWDVAHAYNTIVVVIPSSDQRYIILKLFTEVASKIHISNLIVFVLVPAAVRFDGKVLAAGC